MFPSRKNVSRLLKKRWEFWWSIWGVSWSLWRFFPFQRKIFLIKIKREEIKRLRCYVELKKLETSEKCHQQICLANHEKLNQQRSFGLQTVLVNLPISELSKRFLLLVFLGNDNAKKQSEIRENKNTLKFDINRNYRPHFSCPTPQFESSFIFFLSLLSLWKIVKVVGAKLQWKFYTSQTSVFAIWIAILKQ